MSMRSILGIVIIAAFCAAAAPPAFPGWRPIWSREPGTVSATLDQAVRHEDRPSIRIDHTGQKDWSLTREQRLPVAEGDILDLAAWVKVRGTGYTEICFTAYDAKAKAVDWALGARTANQSDNWNLLRTRVVVPSGVVSLEPRIIGYGPATVWTEGFKLDKAGNIRDLSDPKLPPALTLANPALSVNLDTRTATLSVLDRRTGQTWKQYAAAPDMIIRRVKQADGLELELFHVPTGLELKASLALDAKKPELLVRLSGDGELAWPLAFPNPFVTEKGTSLVVPMNEGISFPVDDLSVDPMNLIAYGGHGICMTFWGVTDGQAGHMALIETPDDCTIQIRRHSSLLHIAPRWDAQKGKLGYERRLRYVFFDKGGHVAMCKRYREYAKEIGLLKTFEQKRRENPNIDRLIGAVNVWCWDKDALSIAGELRSAGIERILWSNAGSPQNIQAMNEMGILTSRYDIYQDVMDPAKFGLLNWIHRDWTTAAWPKDLMIGADGQWVRGWKIEAKAGGMIPCGTLCDRQAVPYARERIPAELKTHPYLCRFIDTTTASPWRECYDPNHPMTRTESRRYKMDLLKYVSQEAKLVTGCETGHDAAVPYADYFEGMLSLGPYRVPDAGRNMQKILSEVPAAVAKYQVGHAYRLPLWELVYHDCVVAQWYWGDYNNKLPAIWDKRDQFNALYGTPPMFMFNRAFWKDNKARFVRSYNATAPIARATGYSEMTDHRFLTPDRAVQQTAFANGVTVTVNFGTAAYRIADGSELLGGGIRVTGVK